MQLKSGRSIKASFLQLGTAAVENISTATHLNPRKMKPAEPASIERVSDFHHANEERLMNYTPISMVGIQRPQRLNLGHCNTSRCILDRDWLQCIYLKGKPVCFCMLEAQKPKARCKLTEAIEGRIYRAIRMVARDTEGTNSPLRNRLEPSSQMGELS